MVFCTSALIFVASPETSLLPSSHPLRSAQLADPHAFRDQNGVDRPCPGGVGVEEERAIHDLHLHHRPADPLGLLQGFGPYQQTLVSFFGHHLIPPHPRRTIRPCSSHLQSRPSFRNLASARVRLSLLRLIHTDHLLSYSRSFFAKTPRRRPSPRVIAVACQPARQA